MNCYTVIFVILCCVACLCVLLIIYKSVTHEPIEPAREIHMKISDKVPVSVFDNVDRGYQTSTKKKQKKKAIRDSSIATGVSTTTTPYSWYDVSSDPISSDSSSCDSSSSDSGGDCD